MDRPRERRRIPMRGLRRLFIVVIVIVAAWFGITALHKHLDPNTTKSEEEKEDAAWVASSKHWLDRQSCRWIGICGLAHWHPDPATRPWNKRRADKAWEYAAQGEEEEVDTKYLWEDIPGDGDRMKPGDWDGDTRVLKDVPQYVLDHAPLIHLYSGEQFWPSDIGKHIMHMTPYQNHTALNLSGWQATLQNMHELNEGRKGRYLFMHSKDDVEERPDWLGSAYNKPIPYDDDDEDEEDELLRYTEISTGAIPSQEDKDTWFDSDSSKSESNVSEPSTKSSAPFSPSFRTQSGGPSYRETELRRRLEPALPKPGGYSRAPAILVIVDKGHGIIDAFWFYFYSFNLGTTVLGCRFGNHVGDWEHSLIRFYKGEPKAVFFSAHSGGLAYSYKSVEKGKGKGREGRPVLYSALGSHAMYATPGKHPYVLPFNLLADVTDRGPMWDPALNYYAYHFNTSITHNASAKALLPSPNRPSSPSLKLESQQTMRDTLQPAANNPNAPMGWWWYAGRWGDKFYELSDLRQWRFVGQYHYVNGPLGPRWKNLGRARVCQSRGSCTIVDSLEGKRSWVG